ncbi:MULTISPECIES: tail protein X [unclassified Undibacterium]|uniref:tail protein X n=1 Tax=unclassified Undibacterium TaxID=2630295 RepID=UPI002AC93C19|nr:MULTISPECIES: tail protein X [unclassified Undibacterium]MEB0138005.1 tail protein X [Undibacterium sp. CCC2.1]MEB0170662.1 tail protein X [Undibacterium sp. CCC1.1]MEB0177003.1 tail protein X [Undibacterium sp. CCC3.4]MEB0216291.1 tail protein X [Undibacterium sp. 5I2]WPX42477.1 tail protein X [Undibacterium sp. CCC3.4]
MSFTVYAHQFDTLDLLCWRHVGMTQGVVEAALELNRSIADTGVFIPHGSAVVLPTAEHLAHRTRSHQIVQLWD